VIPASNVNDGKDIKFKFPIGIMEFNKKDTLLQDNMIEEGLGCITANLIGVVAIPMVIMTIQK
jgi:hypothetical protein